jgi:protein involved in polysaccharide export with SLBB domain
LGRRFCGAVLAAGAMIIAAADTVPQTADTAARLSRSSSPDTYASTFRFRAGDGLVVSVYPDSAPFLTGEYWIDDQGYVDIPCLGMVQVHGLSPLELEQRLRAACIQFLPYPNIIVRPVIRLALLGGFFRPGMYYVSPSAPLWEPLREAGGPRREDGLHKLRWERDGDVVSDDLIPYVESGRSLHNMGFKSGDQITVTNAEKMRGWEVFVRDVLPVLSFVVTAALAASTVYIASTQD